MWGLIGAILAPIIKWFADKFGAKRDLQKQEEQIDQQQQAEASSGHIVEQYHDHAQAASREENATLQRAIADGAAGRVPEQAADAQAAIDAANSELR